MLVSFPNFGKSVLVNKPWPLFQLMALGRLGPVLAWILSLTAPSCRREAGPVTTLPLLKEAQIARVTLCGRVHHVSR